MRGISSPWSASATASAAFPAARSAATSCASFTARSGPTTSLALRQSGSRDRALELQEMRGPAPVRNREPRPAADEARHELGWLLVLRPGAHREKTRIVVHPRRLELGNDQRRVVVCRQHEHRQALERHGLVAGQPRQVGPERQEEGVDLQFPHAVPHAREARRPCERGVNRYVGRDGIAHDTSAVSATAPARPEATTARLAW